MFVNFCRHLVERGGRQIPSCLLLKNGERKITSLRNNY